MFVAGLLENPVVPRCLVNMAISTGCLEQMEMGLRLFINLTFVIESWRQIGVLIAGLSMLVLCYSGQVKKMSTVAQVLLLRLVNNLVVSDARHAVYLFNEGILQKVIQVFGTPQ